MSLGLTLLLAALSIETDGRCPAAEDLRSELSLLRPDHPDQKLVVREEGPTLWLELEGTPGRSVPVPDDCQARARMAAVVVASWMGELAAPSLQLPAPPPPGWGTALEVTGAASWNGRLAGMGSLAVRLLPFHRLSFELGAHGQSVRGLGWSTGRAEYWRAGAVAGTTYAFRPGEGWGIRLGAAVLPGVFAVRGFGFDVNHRSQAFDLGLRASAQLGVFLDPLELWVGPFGIGWPTLQSLQQGTQVLGSAPPFEVGIGAALTLGERSWRKRAWGRR